MVSQDKFFAAVGVLHDFCEQMASATKVIDEYTMQECFELSAGDGPDVYRTGDCDLYSTKDGKWGYCLVDGDKPSHTDYENFVCGFETQDAAIQHATDAAYEIASEQAIDTGEF